MSLLRFGQGANKYFIFMFKHKPIKMALLNFYVFDRQIRLTHWPVIAPQYLAIKVECQCYV